VTLAGRLAETEVATVPPLKLLFSWMQVNPLPKLVLEQDVPVVCPSVGNEYATTTRTAERTAPRVFRITFLLSEQVLFPESPQSSWALAQVYTEDFLQAVEADTGTKAFARKQSSFDFSLQNEASMQAIKRPQVCRSHHNNCGPLLANAQCDSCAQIILGTRNTK